MRTKPIMPKEVKYACFPLLYLYITRLKKPFGIIQWIGGEFISIFLLTIGFNNSSNLVYLSLLESDTMIWLVTRAAFCFSIFATFFTLYEVGYIVNDCVIANREPSPTLRFRSCEYWKTIVGAKIVSFILLTIVIWGLFKLDVYIFLLYNIIVVSFFLFLHNRASIEDRGISYFWLQYMRLMVIPFTVTADAYVLLLLSFAILPEVLRRTLRYLRIKFQDGKRRFTTFDLRVFIMSSFFVTIGFFKLSPGYLQLVVIPYAIIVGGILVSIIIQE